MNVSTLKKRAAIQFSRINPFTLIELLVRITC